MSSQDTTPAAIPFRWHAAERFVQATDLIVGSVAAAAAGLMVVVVTADVISRYVTGSSIYIANELARIMFIWTIFLGMPLALSRGRHVGITLFGQLSSGALRRVVHTLVCCAGVALMAILVVKSCQSVLSSWTQGLQTLPFSASIFYMPIPLSSALCLVYLIIMMVEERSVLIDQQSEGVEA